MTILNKSALTLLFEQGDVPSGTNYADLIASQVNLGETTNQSMAGALTTTELVTPRVSAADVNVTGTLSVATFSAATLNANTLTATNVSAQALFATTVSADAIYASAARVVGGLYSGVGVVSAAGTTQGAAAILTNVVNRGKGVADGVTTGFAPPGNRAGWVQYLYNEGPSANLWPPTGGTINGLAANAAFPLAASAMVTIVHLTASAMAVK